MEFTSHFSAAALAVLGLLVFLAGFVDALAGGGGFIALPAYLAAGIDPKFLLGTNKLSSMLGTSAACLKYNNHVKLSFEKLPLYILCTLGGAGLGAYAATLFNPGFVRYILVIGLPPVVWFILTNRDFGAAPAKHIPAAKQISRLCGITAAVGFYDGFFGPGTGTLLAIAFTRFAGLELVPATVLSKYINLSSNIAALAWFLYAGRVDVKLGLLTGVCGVAGNWLGAHAGIKQGRRLIRPMLAIVCAGLLLKIIWDGWIKR
ncbi:MAG: TSUP family transporter [Elusimicrobiales bacterium]|nr:TSUP family transporter [Elusimicrobiales bacterium]